MQLQAFQAFLKAHPEYNISGHTPITLVLIGGSRNSEDAARVVALETMAKEMDIHVCRESCTSISSFAHFLNRKA